MDSIENYHFTVGDLQCVAISDGTETVPVDSFVKGVSPEAWKRALQERGYSLAEATVYFNCLYIQTGSHRILVDTGWGQGAQRRNGALLDRLKTAGVSPAAIDVVIITHGDFDHIGGILDADHQLVFPNAGYILSKAAWEFWSNEAILAQLPESLTGFGRETLPLIQDRLRVIEAGVEFLPGFQLISAPGHRPGHAALAVTSSGEHLLHLADIVGHPLLMEHPDWQWTYDTKADQARVDREQLLNQAVAQNAWVFGAHLPFPGVGRVTQQGEGWRWHPVR
ncbi:MAG: MBL fold metallo-hydrolase [Chloroflexota bacterium]